MRVRTSRLRSLFCGIVNSLRLLAAPTLREQSGPDADEGSLPEEMVREYAPLCARGGLVGERPPGWASDRAVAFMMIPAWCRVNRRADGRPPNGGDGPQDDCREHEGGRD